MNVTDEPMITLSFVLPFDDTEALVAALFVYPLFIFGVIGNLITIITIVKSPKLKSTWNQLIMSLCVSDLLSAGISPFYLHVYSWGYLKWNLGAFLCKMAHAVDNFTSFTTTLHILWFAILRFISLQWPHQFKSFSAKYVKKSIFVIWVVTIGCGFVPYVITFEQYYRDRSLPFVTSKWPHCGLNILENMWFLLYVQVAYPIFYYGPFFLILLFSFSIGGKLVLMRKERKAKRGNRDTSESEIRRRRKENQILIQLMLIVDSFLFGYFPTTAYIYYAVYVPFTTAQAHWNSFWRFAIVVFIMLRVSECLNPIFYNLSSRDMKNETISLLKAWWMKISCRKNEIQPGVASVYETTQAISSYV